MSQTATFTEVLSFLTDHAPLELALIGEEGFLAYYLNNGWDKNHIFIVEPPIIDVALIVRHGAFLQRLVLTGLGVDDDDVHAISSLTSLTFLDLTDNKVSNDGAHALTSLTSLTFLDLTNNTISSRGARALAFLTSLTCLDLENNQIGQNGARAISSLSALTILNVANNRIGDDGARALASLTAITDLRISRNKIGDDGARALAGLPSLTSLDLDNNHIGDKGVRALTKLKRLVILKLDNNPKIKLPPEILDSCDAQAIFAAYRRYKASPTQALNEAKVLVVGNEAVGKTSLIRYLTHETPRNPDERKTVGITAHERIETHDWSPAGGGPSLHIWDFGGQEILHETHKFFLTERSIYLLVLEDRREDDTSIFKWLKTIANRGGTSPVIVVINKCDDSQPKLLLDETGILNNWPNVVAFLRTSCNSGALAADSIARLRATIAEILADKQRLPHVHDPLPDPWRRVKEAVASRASAEKVLTHFDFVRFCENASDGDEIVDEHEQRALLRLLHDLGIVIAYGLTKDAPAAIQTVQLLDPNWLTGAIYTVLTAGLVVHQGGNLRREQFATLLSPTLYPEKHWEFILSMMQLDNMGLCFPLPGKQGEYLVPEALPKSAPNYDQWPANSLRFRFTYDFLPPGLIPRLIVEAHQKVTETRWRSGAIFAAADCQILVRGHLDKHRLDILVTGPAGMQRSALNVIIEDLRRVHEHNREASPQARVPLPDNPEATVSYDHLLDLERRHGSDYLHAPEGSHREYRVGELLDGVGRNIQSDSPSPARKPRPRTCDVLIVTALKEELDALLAVTGTTWTKHEGKPAYYTCTLDGDTGLRLVALRLTGMGGVKLATLASPLVERFAPRCLAMCGVCAGHPDDTDLGDIVLADRVFQHDEGKHKTDGFQGDFWVHANIDTWNYEAQELEGAVRGLHGHADASAEDARWWFLEKLLTGKDPIKSNAMRRFFPDAQRGPLLESLETDGLVTFEQDAFALTDAGRAKLQRHLKFNGTLVTTRPYHVHVGPIASGNAIMADGAIWTNLPGQRKTLAVEMEAAALGELAHQHKLPFAIAKGVMDHADKHKTDRFKNFAARASAEVLCHFLRRALSPA